MIAAIALMTQAAVSTPVLPPQDWSTLPMLQFERAVADNPALAEFVRTEVRQGHCAAQRATATGWTINIDIALLVTPQGLVRRSVPRAIGCPGVEQYAAGLAFSRAMGNVATDGMATDGWYRTTMAFAWPG